jgi:hypothetical protein
MRRNFRRRFFNRRNTADHYDEADCARTSRCAQFINGSGPAASALCCVGGDETRATRLYYQKASA